MTDSMPPPAKLPEHERVYRRLRDMVLFGELAPGQAVTIQGLVALLDAGATPVREAIRRLTAERALSALGNRRVCVPELNRAQVQEIIFARNALEPELARRAAARLSAADIDRLAQVDAALNDAIAAGDVQGYLRENHRFHHDLYARAEAPILAAMVQALWLRIGPSLRVVCGRIGTANLPDLHDETLAALRARDDVAAARAIRGDIAQGHDQILASLDVK